MVYVAGIWGWVFSRTEGTSEGMTELTWTWEKPTNPGWYWYRGPVEESDPLIVLVDEAGYFQWPDGGFQEVVFTKGEWAGPIELPEEP